MDSFNGHCILRDKENKVLALLNIDRVGVTNISLNQVNGNQMRFVLEHANEEIRFLNIKSGSLIDFEEGATFIIVGKANEYVGVLKGFIGDIFYLIIDGEVARRFKKAGSKDFYQEED